MAGRAAAAPAPTDDDADGRRATPPRDRDRSACRVAGSRGVVRASVAPSTSVPYHADWRSFDTWSDIRGYGPTDATPATVTDYVAHQVAAGLAMATIRRRVTAIAFMFTATPAPHQQPTPWSPPPSPAPPHRPHRAAPSPAPA